MTAELTIGPYTISLVNHGFLYLDGGAMFGSVPKALWERKIPPDEKNRIKLATRSLLIEGEGKKILVDVGCGTKWGEKEQSIFSFENIPHEEKPYAYEDITDVILTHLHFDHAAGITHFEDGDTATLSYPNAKIHLQEKNFILGKNPNIRERASYLANHILPLEKGDLNLVSGSVEIYPGIWGHEIHGHTEGQQYIEIRGEDEVLLYPTDLIPTSHHLPLPYHMGYDMCAATVLDEKEAFLTYAMEKDAIVVFEHDPEVAAVRVGKNDRGHYSVKDQLSIFS